MITKQTKEKPLEKASAKDDWKEKIKQELEDNLVLEYNEDETSDGVTRDSAINAIDLAIAKTEEHFKKEIKELEYDRDDWKKKFIKIKKKWVDGK